MPARLRFRNPRTQAVTRSKVGAESACTRVRFVGADPDFVMRDDAPRRSRLLPLSILGALLLVLAVWFVASRSHPARATESFENASLGCRFDYSGELTAGPNFVRNALGSFLTIERHSLQNARKDFVAGLPDALFPQVRIQLDQNYRDLEEVSRQPVTIGGRPALEVRLLGKPGKSSLATVITVDIVATEAWVYVVRSYSPEDRDATERPLFEQVRRTLRFDAAPS